MEGPLSAPAAAAGDGEALDAGCGAQLLRSIAIVTHCVADLGVAEQAWAAVPGYRTVEHGELSPELCAAWDTPAARGQRYCLMQPASGDDCYLRFVETGEPSHPPPATWGWTATELLVTDADDLAARLEGSGFQRLGGPGNLYPRANAPRAMQVIGPSGELIYFTRLLPGGSRYGLKQARSYVDRPFIVTLGGPSSAQLHAFYGSVLGHRVMDRTPFVNGILAALCDAAPSTVFPTAVARIPGRRFLLEMDEFPPHVRARRRRAGHLPPGMSIVSFRVRRLDDFPALKPHPVLTRAPPRRLAGPAYGGRRVAVIAGPVGEWLELIEDNA